MKNSVLLISLILLSGCGKKSPPTRAASYAYPALNESSLPPAPPRVGREAFESNTTDSEAPPASVEIRVSSGLQMEFEKQELLKSLRDYAAKADPGDPFALTEAEIEAISKLDDPMLQ
ncbi:MAG: hypothetical protein PHO37_12155 [Kiritimatiellae bacterium]|nr:hypothetical protein [Kiritimatiellia bacterium]